VTRKAAAKKTPVAKKAKKVVESESESESEEEVHLLICPYYVRHSILSSNESLLNPTIPMLPSTLLTQLILLPTLRRRPPLWCVVPPASPARRQIEYHFIVHSLTLV
jgi:hypothetical protein